MFLEQRGRIVQAQGCKIIVRFFGFWRFHQTTGVNQCPLRASAFVVFDVARTYQSNHIKNKAFSSAKETIFKFWRYWALKSQHAV